MKKAIKIILSSALSMTLCASLIAGSTFALFTSESKTNIAITSGKIALNATAEITKVTSAKWNEDKEGGPGYTYPDLYTGSYEAGKTYNFTNGGSVEYADGTLTLNKITPGDGVEFTIKTTNTSNIAIKYQTVVTFVSGGDITEGDADTGADTTLFHALDITVKEKNGMEHISSDRSTAVSEWSDKVEPGTKIDDIQVSINFPMEGDHNKLQNKSCKIAIGVYAVQANGHDETKKNTFLVFSENLSEALGEAQDGDTLVLGSDLEMPADGLQIGGEGSDKNVSVDLYGNTFGVSKDEATSSEDLVVSKGSTLTVKDSAGDENSKFTVNTNMNSSNAPNDREPTTHGTDDKKYTMKVEGELNFEGVDVEVNNKQGDIGVCVDGGEINFNEGTDLVITGREATDGYGTNGFGKGFYVTNDGEVNFKNATVTSEGAVTSFVVGGEKAGTLNITGGTYEFKDIYNSITHATFVSAFQTYENGTININGANLNLTGKAENKVAKALGGEEDDTEYTNMILISCMGGGDVDVKDTTITLAPELGTAFVAQTVCSYYYTASAEGCSNATARHRGVQCDAHVTFSGTTKIYLNSSKHMTNSEACYVFAASRNGKQLACYESSKNSNSYADELMNSSAPEITRQVAAHEWEEPADGDPYTIKVGKDVEIYFSNAGPNASENLQYYKVQSNSDSSGKDSTGKTHEHYYLYDLTKVSGGQPYFVDFINRYNPKFIEFDYDHEPQP